MLNAAAGIFISYRRQEANYLAGWLHDRLADRFGEARVFLDIDWIKPGVDFMQVITEAIVRSRVLLVIIGPHWLASDGDGFRRLDKPDDPVRVEIETALERNVRVIPLLLEGASMPRAGDLPDPLAGLTRLNALRVGYQSFRSDIARLVEVLALELGIAPSPPSDIADIADVAAMGGPEPRRTRKADRAAQVHVGRDEEQRARMLTRLSRTYKEYLSQSVEHDAILQLQLGLDRLPGRTFRPQDRLLPVSEGGQAEPLPAGTTLLEAFDRAGGLDGDGLLVLGEPGAGKTTLLFELVSQLAERAQTDPRRPLPVYLPLSSWATHCPPLEQWLVGQLDELYQIPRPLGRRWTADAQLLFVLDGLDEIPDRTDRIACVKAINRFNRFGRSSRLPMVVASRRIEYDTLTVKLQLETAIGVRPLEPSVVLDELERAPGMQAVFAVVRGDPELLELLRSPLLVSMLTLTYAGVPEMQINVSTHSLAESRHQLITDYVHRRFELDQRTANAHRKRSSSYSPERTRSWLSALALNLAQHQQTVYLPGRTQPEWLPNPWARSVVIAAPELIYGLIFVPLIFGLFGKPGVVPPWLLVVYGLIVVLSVVLVLWPPASGLARLLGYDRQPAERLSWSWRRARPKLRVSLLVGLACGLFMGLLEGLITVARHGPFILVELLLVGLFMLLGGLVLGLVFGLFILLMMGVSKGLISIQFDPYEGFRRSVRNGLIVAVIVGLAFGSLFGLNGDPVVWLKGELATELFFGLAFGLYAGMFYGLGDGLRLGIFRLLLYAHHIAPLRYVHWLNYAVHLRLLYRSTSGGYVFIHRVVQDYFYDAILDRSSEDSPQAQR